MSRAWAFLSRPRGNALWDGVVRATGVLGVAGLLLVGLFPGTGAVVGLGIYTIWIAGPLSPFFPAGLEPILMLFGRVYPPLLIGAVATAGALYVELFNFHLYGKILELDALRPVRSNRVLRWLARVFGKAPFFAVWFTAMTPLPYWGVRVLALLSGYPFRPYLAATALGRLPKFWFFAALGLYVDVSAELLLGVVLGSLGIALLSWAIRRRRGGPARPVEVTGFEGAPPAAAEIGRPT